jgi:ABC-2 type transport system ATP-binding protein
MNNLLEIKNLCKSYDGFSLDNVSFTLEPGYVMGFVGPNGAGKSTTIKLILNLIQKEEGEVKLFGLDSVQDEMEIKQHIGFVLDDTYFPESMTVQQVEWLVSGFYHAWDSEKFRRYLQNFRVPETKKIKELSTGMKAKLSIAVALSHHAKLLILDEPTAGLDPVVRSEILAELFKVVQDPTCGVFFSTHITSDLDKVADYITFLNDGKVTLTLTKDALDENYALVRGGKKQLEAAKPYLLSYQESPYSFEGLTDQARILHKAWGDQLVLEKAKIEDIMLYQRHLEAGHKNAIVAD